MPTNIEAYDLDADKRTTDHDMICTEQAGKLLQIGYLEYETATYASAVYKDDDIYYFVSSKESTIEQFLHECNLKGWYPTPTKYFFKRYDLLHHTEEEVKHLFRMEIAKKLQSYFPPIYFQALQSLITEENKNAAFPLLKEISKQLENCFDMDKLNLFENLLEMLLQGRLLTVEGYLLYQNWLKKECEKISNEKIESGVYNRVFSGFLYKKSQGDKVLSFCDAVPYMAKERQREFFNKGYIVTPILTKKYYSNNFQELQDSRDFFKKELNELASGYLNIMAYIKIIPSDIDAEQYYSWLLRLEKNSTPQAVEAFKAYGYIWNVVQ